MDKSLLRPMQSLTKKSQKKRREIMQQPQKRSTKVNGNWQYPKHPTRGRKYEHCFWNKGNTI
jgi:hypothetical protein